MTERRPLMVDLFCGAGGVTKGYIEAGFDVIGVDVAPQPRYLDSGGLIFTEADWKDGLDFWLDQADVAAIHASPVCKRFSRITRTAVDPEKHPDQIPEVREALRATGLPYVIENVPEAPLLAPVMLCGSMFDLDVRRHRCFETNWDMPDHHWPCRHRIWDKRFHPNRSDRKKNPHALARVISVTGHGNDGPGGRVADWRKAMEIDWMTRDELAQAIPPAYTEWTGRHLLDATGGRRMTTGGDR